MRLLMQEFNRYGQIIVQISLRLQIDSMRFLLILKFHRLQQILEDRINIPELIDRFYDKLENEINMILYNLLKKAA